MNEYAVNITGGKRSYKPTRLVKVSLCVHAMGIILLVVQPDSWPWVLATLIANHVFISSSVLWPGENVLGPKLIRLPASAIARNEIALTFDDGPHPVVTPQVLDLLDRYQMKASFFCIGRNAEAYPEIVQDIVRRGHSVENHSFGHPHGFAFYGIARIRREVGRAQATISRLTGKAPLFFRAPAGFRSPMLDYVLTRIGLHYVAWTRRGFDGVQADPCDVLRRLERGLAAGDILLLHDGACTSADKSAVLVVLPALLQQLSSRGLKSVALPAAFA